MPGGRVAPRIFVAPAAPRCDPLAGPGPDRSRRPLSFHRLRLPRAREAGRGRVRNGHAAPLGPARVARPACATRLPIARRFPRSLQVLKERNAPSMSNASASMKPTAVRWPAQGGSRSRVALAAMPLERTSPCYVLSNESG